MSLGHVDVRRQGSPKAVSKDEVSGYFNIQITLNIDPDAEWQECFKHPAQYKLNEAHPSRAIIAGNTIYFPSSEDHFKDNIEWMDKYISQANECYRRKMVEKEEKIRREEEKQRKQKEEIERINEKLRNL